MKAAVSVAARRCACFDHFFDSSLTNEFRCQLLGIFLKYRLYVCDQMQNPIDFSNICYIFRIKMTYSTIFGANITFLEVRHSGNPFFSLAVPF